MGTKHRLDYKEAAKALGISIDAVRMRVRRGTLRSERDGSRVFVILNADEIPTGHDQGGDPSELVAVLREQLAEEREARRRADTIILQLSQANATLASRVPALQAAADERRDVPASREETTGAYSGTGSREDSEKPASWWKRIIGK
jgi:hypothetical protein